MFTFNKVCHNCKKDEDTEKHYIECDIVKENIDHSVDLTQAKYENIFSSDIEDQVVITKIYDQIFKTRRKLLNM